MTSQSSKLHLIDFKKIYKSKYICDLQAEKKEVIRVKFKTIT